MRRLRFPTLLAAVLALAWTLSSQATHCAQKYVARTPWAGIYPTVLTPWLGCLGGVDEKALTDQIEYQLCGGVHGLLVLGTLGEGEYANMAEREQVIRVAVASTKGAVPVVVGIHTCDLEFAKAQLFQAKELGAAAVLVKFIGCPAGYCEVHAFYRELTACNVLPIFYYHYPSQTRLCLSPCEVAEILKLPGIVGIKESTLNLKETREHICLTQGCPLTFLSGTALNLTQFMNAGGHGAMCAEAALLPRRTVCAYDHYVCGNVAAAREVQKSLFVVAPLIRDGFVTEGAARTVTMSMQDLGLPQNMPRTHPQARLKAALDLVGLPTRAEVKCPLPPLSERDFNKVCSSGIGLYGQ